MAFATIALSELALVFAVRSRSRPAWKAPRNPYLSPASRPRSAARARRLPARLHEPLGTVSLDARELAVVGLALLPFACVEVVKAMLRRFAPVWAASALRATR